jgi:hypothetical protein
MTAARSARHRWYERCAASGALRLARIVRLDDGRSCRGAKVGGADCAFTEPRGGEALQQLFPAPSSTGGPQDQVGVTAGHIPTLCPADVRVDQAHTEQRARDRRGSRLMFLQAATRQQEDTQHERGEGREENAACEAPPPLLIDGPAHGIP